MKKIILILIIFISLISCERKVKEYYPTGELKSEYKLLHGKYNGKVINYYKNGNIENIDFFDKGIKNSVCIWYYPNGKIEVIKKYKDDKEFGYQIFYYKNEQIKAIYYILRDSSAFFIKYDSLGNYTDYFRHIEIMTNKDTIRLGEEYKAKIKLYGTELKGIDKGALQIMLDPVDNESYIITGKNNIFNYEYMPKDTGWYTLNVFFAFVRQNQDFFKSSKSSKSFYVKP